MVSYRWNVRKMPPVQVLSLCSWVCFFRQFIFSTNAIYIYKISCVLRTLWLVSYRVYIRLCKHGCDVTEYFPVIFYKRNRKWTPCAYITWCNRSREFCRIWKYLRKPSPAAWVHINFRILPNSLSRVCITFETQMYADDSTITINYCMVKQWEKYNIELLQWYTKVWII